MYVAYGGLIFIGIFKEAQVPPVIAAGIVVVLFGVIIVSKTIIVPRFIPHFPFVVIPGDFIVKVRIGTVAGIIGVGTDKLIRAFI